jgi:hypothetical protein
MDKHIGKHHAGNETHHYDELKVGLRFLEHRFVIA